jgi:acyl carrier protein
VSTADKDKILQSIFNAIVSINEMRPSDSYLKCDETEVIVGEGSKLDSLGFVTLMVAIEQEINAIHGNCPSLAIELMKPDSDVKDISDLCSYIVSSLG